MESLMEKMKEKQREREEEKKEEKEKAKEQNREKSRKREKVELRGILLGRSLDSLSQVLVNEHEVLCDQIQVDEKRLYVVESINNRSRRLFQLAITCMADTAYFIPGKFFSVSLRSSLNHQPVIGLKGVFRVL